MARRLRVLLIVCAVVVAGTAEAQVGGGGGGTDFTPQINNLQSQINAAQAAIPSSAAITALAPVQAVNTKTGSVVVPTQCRQQSNATSLTSGSNPTALSWTFPLANNPSGCGFATPPSCWSDMSTTATGFVFDQPLNTARSTSGVTYSYSAHASTLTIAIGSLALTAGPPAGSTVVLTCTAPPA